MSGAVVWLTGLPSSGKSTLAGRLVARLRAAGRPAVVLDGDEVRDALVPRPGYTPEERDSFYATLARLAALLARQQLIVLVAATGHRRVYRDRARALSPRFLEVFLEVPAEECRRRDRKGLYAQAASGTVSNLPGAGAEFEPPKAPEVVARGGEDSGALDEILSRLDLAPAGPR